MNLVDNPSSTFTNDELARLTAYRAAVTAGFYTDWDGTDMCTDSDALAWLLRPSPSVADYPFTPDELSRLERCRTAIRAGYYSEELAPTVSDQAA